MKDGGQCLMQEINNTQYFSVQKDQEIEVKDVIADIYEALTEKGYNPVNQIVGYVMSGDPTYITSHKGARSLIRKVERDEIIELLLLHKAQYKDLSKIMTFFKKAIENKKLELNYNEKNKKMILNVTKVADFEEMQIPIELNEKKISNEEIFRLLFEEIKLIKDNKRYQRREIL